MHQSQKCAKDNRANQLSPIHRAYYQSRGDRRKQAMSSAQKFERSLNEVQINEPIAENNATRKAEQFTAINPALNQQQRRRGSED